MKKAIDISFRPWPKSGMILRSGVVSGRPWTPVSSASDGPYTSASRTPTLAPRATSVRARLIAVVLLPTPPLPEATAMMFRTPGRLAIWDPAVWPRAAWRVFAVIVTATCSTPSRARTRSRAARSNSALTGQAGVVSSIAKETLAAVDLEILDESELDDALLEIGVDDRAQGVEHLAGAHGLGHGQSFEGRGLWKWAIRGEPQVSS